MQISLNLEDRALVAEAMAATVPNDTRRFGNVHVELYMMGEHAYRIDWRSQMSGATTSFVNLGRAKYAVIRRWSQNKRLPNIDARFSKRKPAFVHFLQNVDVVRMTKDMIDSAKSFCGDLFTVRENLPSLKSRKFKHARLQGAIGMNVQVFSKTSKDRHIAEGILLQLVGKKCEVQITKRLELVSQKDIMKFDIERVYLV